MPGTRLEIAEALVLHLVEFAIELHDLPVGVTMIDEDIVADDVAARSPDQMIVVAAEEVARALNFRPVLHLEGDVMHFLVRAMRGEVHRGMVGPATHENKKIASPVRHAEPENVLIERRHLLDVGNVEREMTELDHRKSIRGAIDRRER